MKKLEISHFCKKNRKEDRIGFFIFPLKFLRKLMCTCVHKSSEIRGFYEFLNISVRNDGAKKIKKGS